METPDVTEFTEACTLVRRCVDCQAAFEWTVGEQQYFQAHQLRPPKRCKACRRDRRQWMMDADSMGDAVS